MLEVDLLRHGRCEGGEIFRGSTDVRLTADGWDAMNWRLSAWPASPWQRVISSPLQRCQLFARELAERLNKPFALAPNLREMHFGDWDGREISEIWETDAERVSRWREDPALFTPPGGEPFTEFARRVDAAMAHLVQQHSDEHLLVVTHGGILRLLLTRALGLPSTQLRDMNMPYAGLVRLRWTGDTWQLVERHDDAP